MNTAYLGLGSNLGSRRTHLRTAVEGLRERNDVDVTAVSPMYETEAHTRDPNAEQPAFFNAVVEATVACSPEELLSHAHALEAQAGRRRETESRWAPRPLDIDLLTVGAVTCQTDTLILPHPRLGERRFVLRPWADVAPTYRVPAPFDAPVQHLLHQCADSASIREVEGGDSWSRTATDDDSA